MAEVDAPGCVKEVVKATAETLVTKPGAPTSADILQRSAKVGAPGCVNTSGKFGQKSGQRSAKIGAPGLVNFVTAAAYHFAPVCL